jgi:RND family efflux transporter MFP subunit
VNRRISAFLIALAVGATGLQGCNRRKSEAEPVVRAAADEAATRPIEISTAVAIERRIRRSVETVGSLLADEEVTVSSQVRGEVSEMSVDLGSVVKAGQVIARISPREFEFRVQQTEAALAQARAQVGLTGDAERVEVEQVAGVKQAKAALDDAQLNLERARRLFNSGDISRERLDVAETNFRSVEARHQAARDTAFNQIALVEQRRAEVRLARKNLEDSFIRAPISGVVSVKHVSRGEFINDMGGSRAVATIVKSSPVRVQASIAESGVSFVKVGVPVRFTVDAYPGRDFSAVVKRISPALNAQARLLTVEATAQNGDGLLKPGMFARVFVDVSNNYPATLVPGTAVASVAGLYKAFVVENGRVVEREVKLGQREGDLIEITEGVKPGETVAVGTLDKLSDGRKVAVK